jgi:tetratricopeptide (TPR) repeat protein
VDKPDQQRDFFVSYTAADRTWAEWIAWELEAAGYTTVLQAWDMPAGTAFVHAMDQAVQHTRRVVLVLSPAYLRSAMAEAEWRPGFTADPSGAARRLLPVRVEQVEPAGLLADRVWIDLVGTDEATARTRLREEVARALRGPGRPATPPRFPRALAAAVERPRFPTALPGVWNVPYRRNPDFTGRDELLGSLAEALAGRGTAAVTRVLQGAGGIGKTSLVVEYAYRYRSRFDTVWWVRAEQVATLLGDLTDLAVALSLADPEEASQQLAVAAVRRWLDDHDRWLLVLDNAGAPDTPTGLEVPLARLVDLLPQVIHGQVLVTSRDASWEDYAALAELEVFTREEAIGFLLVRSGATDEQAAEEVAELLGWLPLALEQAGAYVRQTRTPLATYLGRLRQFPALALAKGRPRDRDPADTVATTWQVSLERVGPVPGAVSLLEVCAFLAPEAINRELFSQQLDHRAHGLRVLADDPFALDEAIGGLRRFGLVKVGEQTMTVHRLVQQVVRARLAASDREAALTAAVELLAAAFPSSPHELRDPKRWPRCAQLLPHLLVAAEHAQQAGVARATTAALLRRAGGYLERRGEYEAARGLSERALALTEAAYGADHLEVAYVLDALGYLLRVQGDLAGAQAAHERALAISRAAQDPDQLLVASVLHNLGRVLHAKGDLADARTHLERALTIKQAILPRDHPDVASTLGNLGGVLRDQGDVAGARKYVERTLAINELARGRDHPDVGRTLDTLGGLLHLQGDLAGARGHLERALAINEASLGADHPDVGRTLGSLAAILRDQGDLAGARPLYERALAIYEASLGADHPDTAQCLNYLATVLHEEGDLAGARQLYERALAIRRASLGPDHPHTAHSLTNLAFFLHDQGDLAGARTRFERALAIYEASLGLDHPYTALGLNNLATILADQGDLDGARALFERALAIREARLGADHPDTARSRRNLAAVVAELDEQQ